MLHSDGTIHINGQRQCKRETRCNNVCSPLQSQVSAAERASMHDDGLPHAGSGLFFVLPDPESGPASHTTCAMIVWWNIYLLWGLESLWLLPWLQTVTAVRKNDTVMYMYIYIYILKR